MRVVTFGEVMLRLAPEEFLRLSQVLPGRLEATFGGGEVNVAVSVALQGGESAYATVLPDNPLTDAFVSEIRRLGVDHRLVQRSPKGRFGVYFVETGANQRAGTVTYDRDASCMSLAGPETYDWKKILDGATWFHITGITPAISEQAAQAALEAVRQASQRGIPVSCDLNFRKKLWRWQAGKSPVELARQTMRELVKYVDLVIANEEDADMCLGIQAPHSNVEAGEISLEGYGQVAREIVRQFRNVKRVAITLRESISASHNNWGGIFYHAATDSVHCAPVNAAGQYEPYEIRNIVDRVGAGDSFAGGLIFALNSPGLSEPSQAIAYAVAASCLKHSIKGDFNHSSRSEIEGLMKGGGSGRVQR
ncbi:MAG: PfkB family carbohydrate kinase [Planctomycetaceae bacterium]|jgi:2-dehydro-3-deoxygluconokinase